MSRFRRIRTVSPAWALAALVLFAAAASLGALAFFHQRDASRPVGEGALFQREAAEVVAGFDSDADPFEEVRHIRNVLGIEAVAILGPEGTYTVATSQTLIGQEETNPFLSYAASSGVFGAIAGPVPTPIDLDGIEEWPSGSVLYRVVQPLDSGQSLILHYDISELLARRAVMAGIRSETLQLAAGAALLVLVGIALVWARARARRRVLETRRATEVLAQRSKDLEKHNVELDEARSEAVKALALAEETNRIRSDFVMMINHELRTPLTSLITGTELLRSGGVQPSDTPTVLDDMARDGRRLMGLIANILAVARIENRGLDYQLRPTRVSDIFDAVSESSAAAVLRRPDSDPIVSTDPDGIVQLLVSLAENARTHGASSVEISLGDPAEEQVQYVVGTMPPDAVCFLVTDDGPGIDPEFLPRAFEKFEKSSFSAGTGLGLYVARLMVEAIEGSIAVRTGSGGTMMAVAVPADRAAVVAA